MRCGRLRTVASVAGDREAAPAFDADGFLRVARAAARARVPRTDRFVDAYILVLVGAALAAWVWGAVSAMGAQVGSLLEASGPGGPLHRAPAAWLGPGVPWLGVTALVLLAWAGLVRALLVLGPVGIAPDRVFWIWRLPGTDDREAVRALHRLLALTATAAGLLSGCAAIVARWAGAWGPEGLGMWVTVLTVCGTGLGAGAVLLAGRLQASRAGVSRVGQLPGWELRRAGARTRYLGNAVRLASAPDLRQSLSGADQSAVHRPGGRIPGWVRGPRRALLYTALTAETRTAWLRRAGLDLTVVAVLLVAFPKAVLLGAWAGLLFVAYRGLGRGVAYVTDMRAGTAAERLLPVSGAAAARVRLVVPCLLNALALGATAALAGLAAPGPVLPLLAAGSVTGVGVGAAAVHRIMAPEPDLTEPPVETPFGPLPRAQLAGYGRGLLLVLLLAAGPALVVALPHLWLPALTAVVTLTLVALALAATTGRWI